jgi:hypothetical protein
MNRHRFLEDKSDARRVRNGEEDVAHCVECGQAEDRPIHRVRVCDEKAGGCGRSAEEGAVLRDRSALCESCKEAIGEAEAEDAEKLELVKRLVRATVRATKAANGMLGRRSEAPAFRDEQKAAAALLADYLGHAPSAEQIQAVTE